MINPSILKSEKGIYRVYVYDLDDNLINRDEIKFSNGVPKSFLKTLKKDSVECWHKLRTPSGGILVIR